MYSKLNICEDRDLSNFYYLLDDLQQEKLDALTKYGVNPESICHLSSDPSVYMDRLKFYLGLHSQDELKYQPYFIHSILNMDILNSYQSNLQSLIYMKGNTNLAEELAMELKELSQSYAFQVLKILFPLEFNHKELPALNIIQRDVYYEITQLLNFCEYQIKQSNCTMSKVYHNRNVLMSLQDSVRIIHRIIENPIQSTLDNQEYILSAINESANISRKSFYNEIFDFSINEPNDIYVNPEVDYTNAGYNIFYNISALYAFLAINNYIKV